MMPGTYSSISIHLAAVIGSFVSHSNISALELHPFRLTCFSAPRSNDIKSHRFCLVSQLLPCTIRVNFHS